MKCNCILELESNAKDAFAVEGNYLEILSTDMANKYMDDKGNVSLALPISVRHKAETKNGKIVVKNKQYLIAFKYCPFCGALIKGEE